MVIRLWTYSLAAHEAGRFEEFERQYGVPMVQSQPGCLGIEFFRSTSLPGEAPKDQLEYIMISRWENPEILGAALATPAWKDEIKLFQAQHFSDQPGTLRHFELI